MEEIKTPYINIQSDFGFKYVFGNEDNKSALIRFLNILFQGNITVTDVIYHDKEILPQDQDGKRIVYDVYCTTSGKKGESAFFPKYQLKNDEAKKETTHHFILEMQNIYTPPFEERITYYAAKMIAGQGKAGWNYELQPAFAIAITDFNLGHLTPRLLHDVMLVDRETNEALTDKLHVYLCSLKELPQTWEECTTELEQVLFLIKNMDTMDNTSLAYRDGNFTEIFNAARSNRLRKDQVVAYSESLQKLRDTRVGITYAADKAREEGRAEGREEGRAEGREEGRAEGELIERAKSIRMMLSFGIPVEYIAAKYGLSVEEVKLIAESD